MNPADDLDAGYRAMAADTERETEAQAWCNGLTREALADVDTGCVVDHPAVQAWASRLSPSDPQERETLDWIEQVADTDGWTA